MTSFDKSIKQKLERLKRLAFDPKVLRRLGKSAQDVIYKRVKSGFGVNATEGSNIKKRRLDKLSSSYIDYRKGNAIYFKKGGTVVRVPRGTMDFQPPSLGKFGAPGRSNLTLSGQMLEAIDYKIKQNSIELFIKNNIRSKVKPNEKTLTNKKVAELVSEKRPFFALTEGERRIIKTKYENLLRRLSRTLFK